jgi:hypothetical protein
MNYLENIFKYLILAFPISVCISCSSNQKPENAFQADADQARLEHLIYWTGLIEEYFSKLGHYPFQSDLASKDGIGLVRVATKNQQAYFSKSSKKYNENMDNNISHNFQEFPVGALIAILEKGIGREIEEKYDIQKVPTRSPVWYNYFVTKDGYLFWVTCITCGVTNASTLLMDGITPTVNIASKDMVKDVTKSKTRLEMISDPDFQQWVSKGFKKEGFVRKIEAENINDSKQ